MKPQQAGWLVMLVIGATTAAVAQSSTGAALSSIAEFAGRDGLSVLSVPRPSEAESSQLADFGPSLPDAPSTTAERLSSQDAAAPTEQSTPRSPRPMTNAALGPTFLVANGMLLGSTIANVEMIANCRPTACQAVPSSIRNRGALYGIGIPSSLAISSISYRLKRGGTKFWLLPVAAFTAGNIVYAVHASQWSR